MKTLLIIKGPKQPSEIIRLTSFIANADFSDVELHVYDILALTTIESLPANYRLRKASNSEVIINLLAKLEIDESLLPQWMLNAYATAEQLAETIKNESFDVIALSTDDDIGFLLRPALSSKGARNTKFTLFQPPDSEVQTDHFSQLRRDWFNRSLVLNQRSLIESSYSWHERIRRQLAASEPGSQSPTDSKLQNINESLAHVYKQLRKLPESDSQQISHKLRLLNDINTLTYLDRISLWYEMARLERLRGSLPYWLVYQLRILKNLGRSIDSSLPEIQSLLRQSNYSKEAAVLPRMYSQDPIYESSFDSSAQNHLFLPNFVFEKRLEYRTSAAPKVSVIVSMYNAENKLEVFLRRLSDQTLHKNGLLEIVLVDSASPGKELEIALRLQKQFGLSLTYIRSKTKETIQTAWNQGISVSRAPFLSFLGVDETLKPEALEILAAKLEAETKIDWITGSAVTFDVDWSGQFQQQTMFYDRSDMVHDQIFFDTTQLSWVGALYRRDIHNRFGYYDGTFTAAGDTEFKNRIFSKIKAHAIPEVLGIYMNYSEERMTEHPRAEIEDLRALYWYKTAKGVEYSYRSKTTSELEAQIIRASAGFRKTFGASLCTDIDYASSALDVLKKRAPNSPLLRLCPGIETIKKAFRNFEFISPFSQKRADEVLISTMRILAEVSKEHSSILGNPNLNYSIVNDNRFQYYGGPWRNSNAECLNVKDGKAIWI